MKKLIVSAAIAALSFATHAFMLPKVGTGTQPGVWTSNAAGVFKEARTTGYPVFVAVINDSNEGEGCTHCKAFLEKNVSDIEALSKTMPFYMVLLNYWKGAEGYSTSASNYRRDFGTYPILPSVYVSGPDGRVSKGWGYPKIERSMINDIRTELMKFAVPQSQFALMGAAIVPYGASWSGTVIRTGGATASGFVDIRISDPRYVANPATIAWDGSNGSRTFSVQGPADGELVSDEVAVSIVARDFATTSVSYAPQQAVVRFRDPRIALTLEEFKSLNTGFGGLSGSGCWYVPSDGSMTLASGRIDAGQTNALTWSVTYPGKLSVSARNPASGGEILLNGDPLPESETVIEVEPGQTLTFSAVSTNETGIGIGEIGLGTFAFQVSKPVFPPDLPASVTAYKKVPLAVSFAAGSPTPVAYRASGLPQGLKINATSGLISGKPTKAGTSAVTITAANEFGESSVAVTFVVGSKLPASGKFSGILFDESQQMVGSVSWKVSASGKLSATIVQGGRKTKVTDMVETDASGRALFSADGLVMAESDVWIGRWQSFNLYGRKEVKKAGAAWAGSWNAGLTRVPDGYAIVKVKDSGAFTLSGKVSAKNKLAAKGDLLVLSRDFVAEYLPEWLFDWPGNGNVAFAYGWKKTSGRVFDGGFALYSGGSGIGEFQFGGVSYETVYASRWNPAQPLASLAGADFTGAGWSLFKVAVNGKDKVSAAENDFSGKLSVTKKTGVFKGSFKAEGEKAKYEGVLFVRDGILMGIGGGRLDKTPIAVGVGIAD